MHFFSHQPHQRTEFQEKAQTMSQKAYIVEGGQLYKILLLVCRNQAFV
jgi:hypothetical protein